MSNIDEEYLEVAKTNEIANRQIKHVEVKGKEILIANMNALHSMGNLANDNIVTRPFHGAGFDIISGKKIKEPVLTPSQEMEPLPKTWQLYLEHAGQLMAHIKTYDQEIYETKIEGDTIKIKISLASRILWRTSKFTFSSF